jgi:hypothetical protein
MKKYEWWGRVLYHARSADKSLNKWKGEEEKFSLRRKVLIFIAIEHDECNVAGVKMNFSVVLVWSQTNPNRFLLRSENFFEVRVLK